MSGRSATAAVGALIDEFFEAMDAQDWERFSSLNAHDDDVAHVGTERGERWAGWDELEAATRDQFESLTSFEASSRARRVKPIGDGTAACFSEVLDLRIESGGASQELEGARLTGAAERRDDRWVLVQTHLSLPRS